MIIQDVFDSILAMKIVKLIMDFLFTVVLSIFLVFILMNIVYSKREELKLKFISRISDLQFLLRELYQQGSSKALEYRLIYKKDKLRKL